MTTLVWLAASSLVWGGLLFCAVFALQNRFELSGNARQWMWRGAAVLLVLPWVAMPVVGAVAPVLSLPAAFVVVPAPVAPTDASLTHMPLGAPDAVSEAAPTAEEAVGFAVPWMEVLVAVLVAGWLVRLAVAQLGAGRLRRLLAESSPAPEGEGRAALEAWSERLRLRRTPDLRMTPAEVSPFSSGALRPVICLPEAIDRKVRREAIALVVGHECVHVARGDGWWRPVERAVADMLWFNPFAWAMRRELDVARELACDEAVVAASAARRDYARTLRDVAGIVAGLDASAPAASMSLEGGRDLLAMRMKRALAAPARTRAALAAGALLALAAAPMAVAQALLIEAAQPDPPPAPPAVKAVEPPPVPEVGPAQMIAPAPSPAPMAAPMAAPRAAPPPIPAPGVAPAPVLRIDPAPAPAPPPVAPPAPVTALQPIEQPVTGVIRAESGKTVKLPFPARVVDVRDKTAKGKGLEVTLVQSEDSDTMEGCTAMLAGMERLDVKDGDTLAKGASIGIAGDTPRLSISCQSMGAIRVATGGRQPGDTLAFAPYGSGVIAGPVPPGTVMVAPSAQPVWTPGQPLSPGEPPPVLMIEPGARMKVAPGQPGMVFTPAQRVMPLRMLDTLPQKFDGTSSVLETSARKTRGYGLVVEDGKRGLHEGVDLAARLGTPVHSPGAGTVTFAGDKGRYGNVVEIDLGDGHAVRFAHLGEIKVKQGDSVSPGRAVGTVGDDEYVTGPHLHVEYRYRGHAYDPEKVEGLILTRPG